MAGIFLNTFYDASYAANTVHPIRVQPETTQAKVTSGTGNPVNLSVATIATNNISAQSSLGRKKLGLHARYVRLKLATGSTAPATYAANATTKIPALTTAFYNACTKSATVSYLGTNWVVIGNGGELLR